MTTYIAENSKVFIVLVGWSTTFSSRKTEKNPGRNQARIGLDSYQELAPNQRFSFPDQTREKIYG